MFRKLYQIAVATYKEWAAYRSHMLVSLAVGPLYFFAMYHVWTAVYQHDTSISINGFSLNQIIAYHGISTLLTYLTMDFADWNLQMLIRTGKFMTYLIRPIRHIYFAFSQKVGHRVLGFVFEFIPVYLIFFFLFGIKLIPAYPLWFLLCVTQSFIIQFFFNYSIGITGFWFIKTRGLRMLLGILQNLFAGTFIPLTFFPELLQKVFLFLPFQFTTYVPIKVFLGSYNLAGVFVDIPIIVPIQTGVVILSGGLTFALWTLGIRRFTGVGV